MSRRGRAVAALVAIAALLVGVPVLLLVAVGNPWPGSSRLEMGDEAAIVVGVLAVLSWLAWLRFVAAVIVEVRVQVAELRAAAEPHAIHPALTPPPARAGAGLLAQRLVAAALVLLPLAAPRQDTARAEDGGGPTARPAATSVAALPAEPASVAAPAVSAPGTDVTVADGDTLFGLARTHLGDSSRWREIFELNRDRLQPDGGRLSSPSLIRTGWRLAMPVASATDAVPSAATSPPPIAPVAPDVPYVAAADVHAATGDTMWGLAHEHLEGAGLPADDGAVADYVHEMAAANQDVAPDPDLIHTGDRLVLPAIGSPPPRARRPSSR